MLLFTIRHAACQRISPTLRATLRRHASSRVPTPPKPAQSTPVAQVKANIPLRAARTLEEFQKQKRIGLAREILEKYGDQKLLYKAPWKVTRYMLFNYVLASACFYAFYYYKSRNFTDVDAIKRQGLSIYVGIAYGVVTVFLLMVAGALMYRARGRFARISLVKGANEPSLKLTYYTLVPFITRTRNVKIGQLHFDGRQKVDVRGLTDIRGQEVTGHVLSQSPTTTMSQMFYWIFSQAQDFLSPRAVIMMYVDQATGPRGGIAQFVHNVFDHKLGLDLTGQFGVNEDTVLALSVRHI